METKPLLYGIAGIIIGGLVVSIAASLEKANTPESMSMSQMTKTLEAKKGDEYDKAFLSYMTDHHKSALDMAKLSAERAAHDEIKQLSGDIITAQENEITRMKEWQVKWGYASEPMNMPANH